MIGLKGYILSSGAIVSYYDLLGKSHFVANKNRYSRSRSVELNESTA